MLTLDQWRRADEFRKAVGMRDDPWHRDHGETAEVVQFKTKQQLAEEEARKRVLEAARRLDW